MNDMRKLMEMVENSGYENPAYLAAKLYLSHPGLVKPAMAKEVSEQAGIDYDIAVSMIDAIDAYEDIREAPEVWAQSKRKGLEEASYGKDDDPTCDWCGGKMQWCPVCNQWTKTCCQDYGTCQCS